MTKGTLCSSPRLSFSLVSVLFSLLSPTKKNTLLYNVFSLSAFLIKTSVNTFPCPWCRWISTRVWRKLNINGVSFLHIILHNNLLFQLPSLPFSKPKLPRFSREKERERENTEGKKTHFVDKHIYITLLNRSWPVMFAAHNLLLIIPPASSSDP